jgi:hypothetical protein
MTTSPYDEPLSGLREHVENLATWLAIWEARQEPDAHARRAANDAVDTVDAMLRDLYLIRGRLAAEIRDATAARADALLRRRAVQTPTAESASSGDVPNRDHP